METYIKVLVLHGNSLYGGDNVEWRKRRRRGHRVLGAEMSRNPTQFESCSRSVSSIELIDFKVDARCKVALVICMVSVRSFRTYLSVEVNQQHSCLVRGN